MSIDREWMKRRKAKILSDPNDPCHGKPSGWRYGCHCERCRAAIVANNKERAKRKMAKDITVPSPPVQAAPRWSEQPAAPKPNPVRVEKQAKARAQRDAKRRKAPVLNELDANNMRGCSVRYDPPRCAVCGRYGRVEEHHVVKRSQGGTDGPTIMLCGFGNNLKDADGRYLCHGRAEQHMLHFRWHAADPREGEWNADGGFFGEGWWEYLETKVPMKYGNALLLGGWKRLGGA